MKNCIFKSVQSILIVLLVVTSTMVGNNIVDKKIVNDNINKSIDLSLMAMRVEEEVKNDIYNSKNTFSGDLTGYVYNCPMCSGRLACKSNYYIGDGKVTYSDPVYGNVRIVASSTNLPCGSIVKFNFSQVSSDPIVAIVLDRGVRGNALDLLAPDMASARIIGRRSITYDVLREGFGV